MLDPIIRKHIQEQDKIEEALRADIDKLFESLDIDNVLANPRETFFGIAEQVEILISDRYSLDALENGIKFAKTAEKMKRDLVIQDTEDSDINKESEKDILESRSEFKG